MFGFLLRISLVLFALSGGAQLAAVSAQEQVLCSDFGRWRDAQEYYNTHLEATQLDTDGNGFACEWMTSHAAARRSGLVDEYFERLDANIQENERAAQAQQRREGLTWNIILILMILAVLGYFAFMSITSLRWKPAPTTNQSRQAIPELQPITDRIRDLQAMKYEDYLKTPEWKATRKRTIENQGTVCRDCGTNLAPYQIEVHHRFYEDAWRRNIVGREEDRHLMVLCSTCHGKRHGETIEPRL